MKKLIFISLIGLMFTSCENTSINNLQPIVVRKIQYNDNGYCYYYSDGFWKLLDMCGKYNIGDTIKLN